MYGLKFLGDVFVGRGLCCFTIDNVISNIHRLVSFGAIWGVVVRYISKPQEEVTVETPT